MKDIFFRKNNEIVFTKTIFGFLDSLSRLRDVDRQQTVEGIVAQVQKEYESMSTSTSSNSTRSKSNKKRLTAAQVRGYLFWKLQLILDLR